MLVNHLFEIFILLFGIFIVFVGCNVACEYRNYSAGHKFIKAFKAYSAFQRLFTVLQRSADINEWDMGKITHIGYALSIICTATGVLVIPFSIIIYFFNPHIAIWTYLYWCGGCFALALLAFIIQFLDSLLNFLSELFKK